MQQQQQYQQHLDIIHQQQLQMQLQQQHKLHHQLRYQNHFLNYQRSLHRYDLQIQKG
jgi:hypothetical protein